ncbi:MAG TPA: quinone-dependent dihydroorotate dehydrogenase [Anaerolineales bacterium]
MYSFFGPLLFKLDPEIAHHLTLQLIRLGAYQPLNILLRAIYATPGKPVEVFGLHFPNPVGLAAGYDKDGLAWRGLAALGFGHIEVGTVTPRPQPGNPKPRVFRLVEDRAIINRMGFPGLGADYVYGKLRGHNDSKVIVGVNLGKNKDTPLENAAGDYISLMRQFISLADYLAINVSSPNTVGLRRLQGRTMLEGLLGAIAKERENIAAGRGGNTPILVKLAPDLSDEELDDALDVILRTGMDGVIATNTSLGRAGLRSKQREETGGLSGEPLRVRSEAVLRSVVKKLDGHLPVVSVGGIMNPEDARARLDAGAALVQIYTGLVYAGPGLVKQIVQNL